MKFLLDTNIFIPLEPTGPAGLEANTGSAAEFIRLAQTGHEVFLHPTLRLDVARDRDEERHAIRDLLAAKYRELEVPPAPKKELTQIFGNPEHGTNDWVDLQHLAALSGDAVDYLVTEDAKLHRRANRAGLEARVLFLADALAVLRGLQPSPPPAPPAAELVRVYSLPNEDPIWRSLRADYKGFDEWLQKCRREHRAAWVVWGPNKEIAALCLMKDETGTVFGMTGRILKMATFKVSERFRGFRYGELLLKAAFNSAESGDHDWCYCTAFSHQAELITLLERFGFDPWNEPNEKGEVVLRKKLKPSERDRVELPPMEFHRRFGPRFFKAEGARSFVVPIQPRFHELLFPDAQAQLSLTAGQHPFGNALRKAYLCHAQTRQIEPGSVLLFYRSQVGHDVSVVGIAEDTLVAASPDAIARFVGTRTVYSSREIQTMVGQGRVLAILFRQARVLLPTIELGLLISSGALRGPPQSVTEVRPEGRRLVDALVADAATVRPQV